MSKGPIPAEVNNNSDTTMDENDDSSPPVVVPQFDDVQFIKIISEFPCLYHKIDRNFGKKEKSDAVWKMIGEELKCEDSELLKKKWINLRKKFTRLRNERSQTNKSTSLLSEQTSEQWPIYDKFEELFGRFIHSRSSRKTNSSRDDNRDKAVASVTCETNIASYCKLYAERLQELPTEAAENLLVKMESLISDVESTYGLNQRKSA